MRTRTTGAHCLTIPVLKRPRDKPIWNCLIYAHETRGAGGTPIHGSGAAANGHPAALVYAHEQDCVWNVVTSECAAEHKSMDLLALFHEQRCERDACICHGAAATWPAGWMRTGTSCNWRVSVTHTNRYVPGMVPRSVRRSSMATLIL